MPKTHRLKTTPEYYQAVKAGDKTAEIRFNDRDFQVGDGLILDEYDPESGYTGESLNLGQITHVLKDFAGLAPGYVMLSFKPK